MQKVLTAAQMREVDRLTTTRYGIPSIILMENAAHAVARVITEKLDGSVKGKSILILCGKGNNGGDGAAVARILHGLAAAPVVCLVGDLESAAGDARTNFEIVSQLANEEAHAPEPRILFREVSSLEDLVSFVSKSFETKGPDLIVDALIGTGLTKPLSGTLRQIAGSLQRGDLSGSKRRIPVMAVDIPTGLDADRAELIGDVVPADSTITFTSPKAANVLPPAARSCGELVVANIGSPRELIDEQPSQLFLAEKQDATNWLWNSRFSDDSYKNKRGHAFLVAGSSDYSGAAVLAANSAMRSGAGLATLACPAEAKTEIASRLLPEVILRTLDPSSDGSELKKADAIAVGCGLDANNTEIESFVRDLVANRTTPVIVDAGALWFFNPPAGIPKQDADEGVRVPLILTPHEGEFLRLLGSEKKNHPVDETSPPNLTADRVAAVREFAQANDVLLVLKGERVLIGHPDGRVVVNPTGNSGLGKAGNGDTLTGILAGFVAQAAAMEIDIFETVVAALYVAGMAGDVAERKFGKRVMTASDVRECLVAVFSELGDR